MLIAYEIIGSINVLLSGSHIKSNGSTGLGGGLGNNVDYASQCVRAVKYTCRTADNLDTLNCIQIKTLQCIDISCFCSILTGYTLSIYQNQCMIGAHTTDGYLVAGHTSLRNVYIVCEAKCAINIISAHFLNILSGDNLNSLRNSLYLFSNLVCGDNYVTALCCISVSRLSYIYSIYRQSQH